ncbi:hypothetical protein GUJ93_ZPchr0004g39156 [Zizania palustris]|uniref:Uncharacterized protein n=1 Tax=Zizania palustris TaxID=103762 RepID=A0A8J5SJS2_ZIZPA|nr:hypothetical protein GUJ93_ZPchr0004g39156 [Zizania palustris]
MSWPSSADRNIEGGVWSPAGVRHPEKKTMFIADGRVSPRVSPDKLRGTAISDCVSVPICGKTAVSAADAEVARGDVVRVASADVAKVRHNTGMSSVEVLHGDAEASMARCDDRREGVRCSRGAALRHGVTVMERSLWWRSRA